MVITLLLIGKRTPSRSSVPKDFEDVLPPLHANQLLWSVYHAGPYRSFRMLLSEFFRCRVINLKSRRIDDDFIDIACCLE
jgi:hypothetical protein